jgi:hypothetical protein
MLNKIENYEGKDKSEENFVDYENKCYVFELVSPLQTIVVSHKENDIILIGVRNLETLLEEHHKLIGDKLG